MRIAVALTLAVVACAEPLAPSPAPVEDSVSDVGDPVAPAAPTIALLAPTPDAVLDEDDPVAFEALVSDWDGDMGDLEVGWRESLGDDLSALALTPDDDGYVRGTAHLTPGERTVQVVVTTPDGDDAIDNVEIDVLPSRVPRADVIQPRNHAAVQLGSAIPFEIRTTDGDDAPEDLTVRVSSDIDGIVFEGVPDTRGVVAFTVSDLSAGWHAVTVEVEDPDMQATSVLLAVQLRVAPSILAVVIEPAEPTEFDTLHAVVVGFENPSDAPTVFDVTWVANESTVLQASPGTTSLVGVDWVLPSPLTHLGDQVRATVVVSADGVANVPVTSDPVTIAP